MAEVLPDGDSNVAAVGEHPPHLREGGEPVRKELQAVPAQHEVDAGIGKR